MKVNVVKWINVLKVVEKDDEMMKALLKFCKKLRVVDWDIPGDILGTFSTADIIKCQPSNRLVFNIGGNKYRLVCGYHFGNTYINLFVKFVGTHSEYDRIKVCEVNIPGTFWFGRSDAMKKMDQIEEANAGIALATARLDNEEMVHFLP